jgi:hypothetical protein
VQIPCGKQLTDREESLKKGPQTGPRLVPAQAAAAGTIGVTAQNGEVGNLGLTAAQDADLVNLLKFATDGFATPNPIDTP